MADNDNTQTQGGLPIVPAAPTPVESVSDRTNEQFQKLLESNRQLYEQNEAMRREIKDKFSQPAPAPVAPQQANADDFVEIDEATGQPFINEKRLRSKVKELEEAARRAEEKAENYYKTAQEREVERQNREAFSAYPELNPQSSSFDKNFNLQTRALITDSYVNPQDYGGRPLEFREAADKVRGWTKAVVQPTPTPAPVESNNDKAQAVADLPNAPQQRAPAPSDDADLEYLRDLTRRGGTDGDKALAMRLKHTEHIVGPNTIVQGGE